MVHFFTFDPNGFKSNEANDLRVVFFDGVCGLCNRMVDLLLAIDGEGRIRFSPLQGELAAEQLAESVRTDTDSIVYLREGELYLRSNAVLWICRDLGRPWALAWIFIFLPRFLRDFLYDAVARNRYRLFGKRDTCRVPTPEERARFFD